jgi:DNA-binding NarL/FixJ family response regulator
LEPVLDGLRNKEIAAELQISQRTVRAHRKAIMRKLEVDSVARLVRKVYG